jgi:hypothetical protein
MFGALRSGFLSADEEILYFIQTQGRNKIAALCFVVQFGANNTFTQATVFIQDLF